MKRDNFSCRACGASPALRPGIALHVDHIIPWSRGGDTIDENLQTLCDACNLGKSNVL
ncbi:MAG: HNH endonuclease [Acidobacteria bacterium]|nr:HNH endonuclease [Acidobacteriota bacterium]